MVILCYLSRCLVTPIPASEPGSYCTNWANATETMLALIIAWIFERLATLDF